MNIAIDFDLFKKTTGFDIKLFLSECNSFFINDYQDIVNYYNGGDYVPSGAFSILDDLLNRSYIVDSLFRIKGTSLKNIDMWELLDIFSDIQVKLITTSKLSKWLKSSRLTRNSVLTKIDSIQLQNETIEEISNNLGDNDYQNDWVDLAIDNLLIEEDYTMEGGKLLTLTYKNDANSSIPNIIDYCVNKNVLGKDICKKFEFVNNDLKTVEYDDAISQSFQIKLSIQKNSIPQFPFYGTEGNEIGSDYASLIIMSTIRELNNLFNKDKRWASFFVNSIKKENDYVFVEVEAKTILNNSEKTNIIL